MRVLLCTVMVLALIAFPALAAAPPNDNTVGVVNKIEPPPASPNIKFGQEMIIYQWTLCIDGLEAEALATARAQGPEKEAQALAFINKKVPRCAQFKEMRVIFRRSVAQNTYSALVYTNGGWGTAFVVSPPSR